MKKRTVAIIVMALLAALLTSCASGERVFYKDVDFASSPYKHVNNGGVTDDPTLPYNIDAITGATVTVEGPGVVASIPLSVRELENRNDGAVRGQYRDKTGTFIYEGIDLYYILNEMVDGDNGIILTDTAYKVVLKNANRATISEFTLAEVAQAHADGDPILLAYGIGTVDETIYAPFVFDSANKGEHSLGYIKKLDNEDGCVKLVYNLKTVGENKDYKSFTNVAYVYLCEETEPGFKHTLADESTYGTSKYTDYIITFGGDALGYRYDMTVAELENLVVYNKDGSVQTGGLGYSDFYSLANTTYWYTNEYEGLDLYKLLLYFGMDDADTMGTKAARTTLVSFIAADGVASSETFSVDTLSYPDAFGFYNKNAADLGDGAYVPTNADLVKTGYPVLLAYGVNNYPYTINKTDDAYLSGLANSGGPIRVVFGKTQYNHANGSNQVQYLSQVIAGENVLYNTHQYTDNKAHNVLASNTISIVVNSETGQTLIDRNVTVGEIEDIVYAEGVEGNVKKAASVKNSYETPDEAGYQTGIYEGIDLEYFLMNVIGLPGTNGTVTFSNGTQTLEISLEELFREGYNSALGRKGLASVLAFAKNGAPLVKDAGADGYLAQLPLHPLGATDPADYAVDNAGGPLAVLIPSMTAATADAQSLMNITSIEINLVPDAYAHIEPPYNQLAADTVRFYGDGLETEKTYSVAELEAKQTKTKTLDFSVGGTAVNSSTQARYRGISLYELFTEIGIKNNAGAVTVYAQDGSAQTFSLSQLKKSYTNFAAPDKAQVCALLAYGVGTVDGDVMQGTPLVFGSIPGTGYSAQAGNDTGPLMLVMPQETADSDNQALWISNVVAVEVSANEIDTWGHGMSDIYEEFADDIFTLTVKNDAHEWTREFTVAELEAMKSIIVHDNYSVLDIGTCEGVDIWKLIQKAAAGVNGIDNPVAVTAYASDGYKNDLLSVFYKEGFVQGVADENGNRKTLILAYAINGYPLVDSESHEGYTGLAGNGAGPLRVVAETNQGASVKYCNKIVVTLAGSDPIAPDDGIIID